jgi:hypothetical protein
MLDLAREIIGSQPIWIKIAARKRRLRSPAACMSIDKGRGLTTPTLVIFIGVIGGTLAHGIVGLFIGSIILSLAWELTVAWIHNYCAGPAAEAAVER